MSAPNNTFFRVIGQWLDSDYRREDQPDPATLPEKVNWERTLPFIFLHLGCLTVFWVGINWTVLLAAILSLFLTPHFQNLAPTSVFIRSVGK